MQENKRKEIKSGNYFAELRNKYNFARKINDILI